MRMLCGERKGVWPPDPECFDGAAPARETAEEKSAALRKR